MDGTNSITIPFVNRCFQLSFSNNYLIISTHSLSANSILLMKVLEGVTFFSFVHFYFVTQPLTSFTVNAGRCNTFKLHWNPNHRKLSQNLSAYHFEEGKSKKRNVDSSWRHFIEHLIYDTLNLFCVPKNLWCLSIKDLWYSRI